MSQQENLCDLKCAPCHDTTIPPLTREEIAPLLAQVPEWTLAEDAKSITRSFTFKGKSAYKDAQAFDQRFGPKICELAEAAENQHHPDIAYGWGYWRVTFQTHAIKGLHQNDFIMAAKIDTLLK